MSIKNKISSVILCLIIVFSFVGCTKKQPSADNINSVVFAGSNTDLKRDGTPKKYFTLGFDDGITQDKRIIEILKKYDAYCATFFINTGLFGKDSPEVGIDLGRSDITHLRFTEKELNTGIYDGFDLESHSYDHISLTAYDNDVDTLKSIMKLETKKITEISGYEPIGIAYPVGTYTEKTIDNLLKCTNIKFARTINETNGFSLPKNFMLWSPTCSVVNSNLLNLAKKFVDYDCKQDMLFYVWGHGYNLDCDEKFWSDFEQLIKMMSEADDIVLLTNAEFYQLFKDEIPSKR